MLCLVQLLEHYPAMGSPLALGLENVVDGRYGAVRPGLESI
jgi:hypothetical protein